MVVELRSRQTIPNIPWAHLMAITDFASLKAAVADWADVGSNISDDRLSDFVQLTTQMLNNGSQDMPALRVRGMEVIDTLTPTNGVYTLPDDYLQYRRVVEDASWRRELTYITPDGVDELYPDRAAGLSTHFTIIGNSLYTYPTSSNDLEMTYYGRLPDLSDANPANWLLIACPGVYLHGCLFQMAMYRRDADLQTRSAGMTMTLVSGLMGTDTLANYAYAPGRPRGIVIA
jgi:hypothetical protein